MSRLIREKKPARSKFAPCLSSEQEAARIKQAKADRERIVYGLVQRANQKPRWSGLKSRSSVPRKERNALCARLCFGDSGVA